MLYVWLEKKSGKQVEVSRRSQDYKVEPSREEAEMNEEEYSQAEWERIISNKGTTIGFGQKGHWIILIGTVICSGYLDLIL